MVPTSTIKAIAKEIFNDLEEIIPESTIKNGFTALGKDRLEAFKEIKEKWTK